MNRPIWDDTDNEPWPYYAGWENTRYPMFYRSQIEKGTPAYASHAVQKGWEEWYADYHAAIRRLGRVLIVSDKKRFESLVSARAEPTLGMVRAELLDVIRVFN